MTVPSGMQEGAKAPPANRTATSALRRAATTALIACFVAGLGCGRASYDGRMSRTIAGMVYRKRLDDNLMPAPAEGKFNELAIYVRPPKAEALNKVFALGVLPPGLFDLDASFLDPAGHSLHVLARVKRPKKPAAKGAPAAPVEEQATRGEFNADVLSLLTNLYGDSEELQAARLKDETRKLNKYRRLAFATTLNNVPTTLQLYLSKQDAHEVALIFAFASADQAKLSSKLGLCLESFAVGARATRNLSGSIEEEDPAGGESGPSF